MHLPIRSSLNGIWESILERNLTNVSWKDLKAILKQILISWFSRWHLPRSVHAIKLVESTQNDPFSRREASFPMRVVSNDVWTKDWLANPRSEVAHKRRSDKVQALWQRVSRSLQLQDSCKDPRGWEMLSLWTLQLRFNLGSAFGVSYADSFWSETLQVPILRSDFPPETIVEAPWEYLPQSRIRCCNASREDA